MRFLVSFFWGGGSVKQRGLSAQTRERDNARTIRQCHSIFDTALLQFLFPALPSLRVPFFLCGVRTWCWLFFWDCSCEHTATVFFFFFFSFLFFQKGTFKCWNTKLGSTTSPTTIIFQTINLWCADREFTRCSCTLTTYQRAAAQSFRKLGLKWPQREAVQCSGRLFWTKPRCSSTDVQCIPQNLSSKVKSLAQMHGCTNTISRGQTSRAALDNNLFIY